MMSALDIPEARRWEEFYRNRWQHDRSTTERSARMPVRYLATLIGAGREEPVRYALRKQQAVRFVRRSPTVGGLEPDVLDTVLAKADCTREQANAVYRLTALCRVADRFLLPPAARETTTEATLRRRS